MLFIFFHFSCVVSLCYLWHRNTDLQESVGPSPFKVQFSHLFLFDLSNRNKALPSPVVFFSFVSFNLKWRKSEVPGLPFPSGGGSSLFLFSLISCAFLLCSLLNKYLPMYKCQVPLVLMRWFSLKKKKRLRASSHLSECVLFFSLL